MIKPQKINFSDMAKDSAISLHKEIAIKNEDWHKLKNNKKRRSAELISSALIKLIMNGETKDIVEELLQSIRWLKNEIKDPGCPDH
tara:strand:- start:202 stop:459 length:258 start_codon:yes stop_codon:yes gene_type:complete